MPRTAEQFSEIRDRTKRKIEKTALKLFGTAGYHATSIEAIATKANISKGLIYYHFKSKNDLLLIIAESEFKKQVDEWNTLLASKVEAREKIGLAIDFFIDKLINEEHQIRQLRNLISQKGILNEIDVVLAPLQAKYAQTMHEQFRALGFANPEEEFQIYITFMEGIASNYLQLGESYPILRMKGFMLNRYGILRHEERGLLKT